MRVNTIGVGDGISDYFIKQCAELGKGSSIFL